MEPKQPLGAPELPRATKVPVPHVEPLQSATVTSASEDEPDVLNEHVVDPGDPDGIVEAEERRRWEAEHQRELEAKAKARAGDAAEPRKKRCWPWALLVVLLLTAVGGAAYWYGTQRTQSTTHKTSSGQTATKTQTAQPDDSAAEQSVPTKHYSSTLHSLDLDYPETWKVTDTDARLLIVSPTVLLKTADGKTANAHVVVTIQGKQTAFSGYPADDSAFAVIASEKLTYQKPTQVQRAQTYLTYVSYGASNSLNALFITGDNGYQLNQAVPLSAVIAGDPSISVQFESCTSEDCASGTPTLLAVQAANWQSSASSKQLTQLLTSLQLN